MTTPKEDERRLYQCARKYEKIVEQLIETMNTRTRQPKRRRVPSTITKFLNEIRANPSTDTDSSASTRERDPE
ncbi:hypothetical protein NC651_016044 [Populus alba x Populus x berolinensis]|nr:hypothetical protein NC651_016044 [Populus alba x Populus x berolinensis]